MECGPRIYIFTTTGVCSLNPGRPWEKSDVSWEFSWELSWEFSWEFSMGILLVILVGIPIGIPLGIPLGNFQGHSHRNSLGNSLGDSHENSLGNFLWEFPWGFLWEFPSYGNSLKKFQGNSYENPNGGGARGWRPRRDGAPGINFGRSRELGINTARTPTAGSCLGKRR